MVDDIGAGISIGEWYFEWHRYGVWCNRGVGFINCL